MKMIDDKEAYIKEIQLFLSTLFDDGGVIFKSGIYDELTKNALLRFKCENGLASDTVVDKETYELLYKSYLKKVKNYAAPLKKNDKGDEVLYLNTMLRAVAGEYSYLSAPRASRFYSAETERSVLELKEIFRMPKTDGADGEFLKRLEYEYKLTVG